MGCPGPCDSSARIWSQAAHPRAHVRSHITGCLWLTKGLARDFLRWRNWDSNPGLCDPDPLPAPPLVTSPLWLLFCLQQNGQNSRRMERAGCQLPPPRSVSLHDVRVEWGSGARLLAFPHIDCVWLGAGHQPARCLSLPIRTMGTV